MPFEHLAAYSLPDLKVNYGPWEVRKPFPWAQVVAAITPGLVSAAQSFTPEARLKAAYEKDRLTYLRAHPDLAFGGKFADPLLEEKRRHLNAETKSLLDKSHPYTGSYSHYDDETAPVGTGYTGADLGDLPDAEQPPDATGNIVPALDPDSVQPVSLTFK